MPRYAAFLRAVNLGPTNKVSGAQLREEFAAAGFDDVATFRTSGNVVFSSAKKPARAQIEKHLEREVGFKIPVFLRTANEIKAIAKEEPFEPTAVEGSKGKLQVILLDSKPTAAKQTEVLALATDADRLAFGKQELYWLPSGGTIDSDLDLKRIAKVLGGSSTMRTKGTVDLIAAKFFQRDTGAHEP
jgi:uncharacterized protein (DUF1697 family)